MVRQAPVIFVMAPPINLGAWSMAMAAFCIIVVASLCILPSICCHLRAQVYTSSLMFAIVLFTAVMDSVYLSVSVCYSRPVITSIDCLLTTLMAVGTNRSISHSPEPLNYA